MDKQKHFVNLTNGIEFVEGLIKGGFEVHFVRVQSTTIERKNWQKLIGDLDHNLLMYLALGYECFFYDCGTNRPLSKTCYTGVHLINYILARRWTGKTIDAKRLSRDGKNTFNEEGLYNHIYDGLFTHNQSSESKALKRKIDYYKRFIQGDIGQLVEVSCSTENDGKYKHYSNLINNLL